MSQTGLLSSLDRSFSSSNELAQFLLFREMAALDGQAWGDWLKLYAQDASFWIPAWIDEHHITSDPATQTSMIYHVSRDALEERVWRIGSRRSVTALPLPRTHHMISGALLSRIEDDTLSVECNGITSMYDVRLKQLSQIFSRYEYIYHYTAQDWLIWKKKIVITNDSLPAFVDFYSV